MKTIFLFTSLLFFVTLSAESQNVYYSELRVNPAVRIEDDILFVYASGSTRNPGMFIYRLFFSVDEKSKSIFISANQAGGRLYQTKFLIDLKRYKIQKPLSYTYYWVDPDRKRNQMTMITESETQKYEN